MALRGGAGEKPPRVGRRPAPGWCYRHDYLVMDRRSTATLICDWGRMLRPRPFSGSGPFEREQRLRKHGRWCAGICGNSLLQAAEAGLQLVGTELSEERKGAQAEPFEHVTAGAGGRLGNCAEAGNAPAGRREHRDDLVHRLKQRGVHLKAAGEVLQPPRPWMLVAEIRAQ